MANAPEGSLIVNGTKGRMPSFYQYKEGDKEADADLTEDHNLQPECGHESRAQNGVEHEAGAHKGVEHEAGAHKVVEQKNKTMPKRSAYIPKSNRALARRLAQKGYDEKMLIWTKRAELRLGKLIESYDHNGPEIIYNSLSDIRQSLVVPYILPDDAFLENWLGKWILNRNTIPKKDETYSERGEQVRSKSEKIIADKLYAEGIPYVYEPEIILDDGERVYPDFAVLNVRTRKEYLFEHFGRMDETGYCKKNIRRIEEYAISGYVLGDNLLATFETNGNLFDPRYLDVLVNQYLK